MTAKHTRQQMWDRLEGTFDLLVIGGGINGCGIARDAARRGLSVALVEMRDFAFGTSSRSSKLVHGGLRYLEHYEFSLVFEAVSERRILLDIAPHLVNPLGFLFPVYKDSRRKLWFINAGMWVYDGLSLFRSPRRHLTLKPAEVATEEPVLRMEELTGAPLYYDCSTDDARLTLENAVDAARQGAVLATWARARAFLKDDVGRVVGAMVEDELDGGLREIRARAIINATGPWTDRTVAMSRPLGAGPLLRPTKGVHIVVAHDKLPVNHAVVCLHPVDGRVLFAIPWGDRTFVGTTDTDFDGDPAEVDATAEDVAYLIDAAASYFPSCPLTSDDVIATWAGLRPLMAPLSGDGDVDESAVSREHQIVVGQDGLITIAGGKLTTYRRMSAEVVDTAVKMLRLRSGLRRRLPPAHTDEEPLPGGVGWPEDDDHEAVGKRVCAAADGILSSEVGRHLADTYGMCAMDIAARVKAAPELAEPLVPGRPEILAQVDWAVEMEMAGRVSDVMTRRTQLYYRDLDQGLGATQKVAERMAGMLGWSAERTASEVEAYREEVARSRAWQEG